MNALRILIAAAALIGAQAHAQAPGEITFWESVRDSKNPAELRAYLQQFPNGIFASLAKARLAALESSPAAPAARPAPAPVASTAPALVAGQKRTPQTGDIWTYRLSYPRLRGQWGQQQKPPATHSITLGSIGDGRIVDTLSIDGGTPVTVTHEPDPTLLAQGVSIFSPYPFALDKLPGSQWRRSLNSAEAACTRQYICEAKARNAGTETVRVPAGSFVATKVIVEQEWRGATAFGARLTGGRTLTVWYAPEIGRAVKFESRITVGEFTPMEAPNFDLELVSYQLK